MNSSDKPVVLLDIDGVTNAFRHRPAPGLPKYNRRKIMGYTIRFRPEWADWVDELAESADVVWATMWMEDAVNHFAPRTGIGKNIDRFIDFDAHHDVAQSLWTGAEVGPYKHPGIVATVGDRPFIWIDDDISDWQHTWALERNKSIPTLLLQPDPAVGLTEEHMAEARRFVENCG